MNSLSEYEESVIRAVDRKLDTQDVNHRRWCDGIEEGYACACRGCVNGGLKGFKDKRRWLEWLERHRLKRIGQQ